jgi:hypothetical protein
MARLGYDSTYTDVWEAALQVNDRAHVRLRFYTALFSAVLLSEHGLRFNRARAVAFDSASITRLRTLFEGQMADLAR